MNKWMVFLYHHPLGQWGERLSVYSTQAVARWLANHDEQIDRVTPKLAIAAIKQVIWRIIINGAIVCLLLSMAIASGYLKFQLPSPQHQNLFLWLGAVGCNLLLTQLLNFRQVISLLFFVCCLGGAIVLAHFLPAVHSAILYLYTSWLLLFLVPICYWLIVAAFDLVKFRNLLIMVGAILSTIVYSCAAIAQVSNWQWGVDLLGMANRFTLYTAIVCTLIFMIFGTISKLLELSLKLTISSIREAVKIFKN
jgi:hypothetical protein